MRGAGEHCPDDLLARSRRGPLSPVERRALDAHLGVCGLCRAAVMLGALHDGVPDAPSDDDEAVVARLAGRVVAGAGRRSRRARPMAIAAAIALTVMAGAAAAWKLARRAPAPPLLHAVASVSRRSPPASAPLATAASAPTAAIGARAGTATHRRHGPTIERAPVEVTEPEGPDTLFARANAARGAGDLRTAAASYTRLESEYPRSPEATVSLLSAGDLLARLGEQAAALERFDRDLAASAGGPLAPEALFGRARCLHELGRSPEEIDAWRALLRRFPGSLYDRTARRRLAELHGDGPAP